MEPTDKQLETSLVNPQQVEKPLQGTPVSAATLILQWLTYAFWGWCALAIIWLGAVVFGHFLNPNDYYSVYYNPAPDIAYPIAATIVLAVIATLCDVWYARRETAKKTGAAMVIMVIHTVLFSLCTIGAAIAAVFSLVNMFVGSDGSQSIMVVLSTALVSFVFYAVLTARTALFGHIKYIRPIAWIIIGGIIITLLVMSIAGPILEANRTKQDRRIESAIQNIPNVMSSYVSSHKALPKTLSELANSPYYLSDADKAVIKENLITYTPNSKESESGGISLQSSSTNTADMPTSSLTATSQIYYYQLCATFDAARDTSSQYPPSVIPGKNDYQREVYSDMSHPKGYHCYKLFTESSSYINY